MKHLDDHVVKQFLSSQGLLAEALDLRAETALFLENLRYGLAHENTAMHMLPSYIRVGKAVPTGEKVLVMDAGGSNLRLAAMEFNSRSEGIAEHFTTYRMPGSDGAVERDDFFDTLIDYLRPVLPLSRKLGLCFSFATEILPNCDGKPLPFSKEVRLPGVAGERLGEQLRLALKRANIDGTLEVCVLNDTTAALLGGIAQAKGRKFSSYVGFILGTGTNTAYIEKTSRITKLLACETGGRMVMNCESGTYPIANRSPIDRAIDAKTQIPGDHLFEKLVSGRYKGTQLLYTLREGVRAGLFSDEFARRLGKMDEQEELSTREIDRFLLCPFAETGVAGLCADARDRARVYALIENLEERSARLVTINFAAILEQLDCGRDPLCPVAFTVDGSTYLKSVRLRPRVEYYVESYIREQLGYYIEILPSNNGNLVGAAVAALTNL